MSPVQMPLTPEQVDQIRGELQRTLQRLERCLPKDSEGPAPEIDQSAVGRLSRIEALQNAGLAQNLRERERVKLDAVVEALRRLDAGGYGVCADCESGIQFERLLVFPEALTCAHCGGN